MENTLCKDADWVASPRQVLRFASLIAVHNKLRDGRARARCCATICIISSRPERAAAPWQGPLKWTQTNVAESVAGQDESVKNRNMWL